MRSWEHVTRESPLSWSIGSLRFDPSGPDSNCGATLKRSTRRLAGQAVPLTGWTETGIGWPVRHCHEIS